MPEFAWRIEPDLRLEAGSGGCYSGNVIYNPANVDFGVDGRTAAQNASDYNADSYFYLHDRLGSDEWWAQMSVLVKFWNAGTIAYRWAI